ncbi:MAG: hypothetical protein RLZZ74_917, partial [Cyanobacteriota bacterium]
LVTSLMAIAYTTKLMYGTLIPKATPVAKSSSSQLPKVEQKVEQKEKARR